MSAQLNTFNQLLIQLNQQWNVDCFVLDEHKQCHLILGQHEISFSLSDDDQELSLWSPVTDAQRVINEKELLIELLMLNHEATFLAGATFSIDRDRRYVLLNFHTPINALDALELGNLLSNFTETVSTAEAEITDLQNKQVSTFNGLDTSSLLPPLGIRL
jgi:hypothetical protein